MSELWFARACALCAALALAVAVPVSCRAEGVEPEGYLHQICDTPQRLTSSILIQSSALTADGGIVWDGRAYAMVWSSDLLGGQDIWFARVAADGTVLTAPVPTISASGNQKNPALVWTGALYGLSWEDDRNGNWDVYAAVLDDSGSVVGGENQITNNMQDQIWPSLVWTGGQFGLAWQDYRLMNWNVFFGLLDPSGSLISGSTVVITLHIAAQVEPSLAWTGDGFGVAYVDYRDPTAPDIYFDLMDASGAVLTGNLPLAITALSEVDPSLVWSGAEFGLAWSDPDVRFVRVSSAGAAIGSPVTVSTGEQPTLAWTGAEYGVAFMANRVVDYDVYFRRLDEEGTVLGNQDVRLTSASSPEWAFARGLAFGTRGYGLGWNLTSPTTRSARFASIGCHWDSTPPSCPEAPAELSRSFSSVTLGWGPSQDNETEVARYEILKGGHAAGTTADLTWTDYGFDPAAGSVYWIQAVNAAGFVSSGCGSVDTTDSVPPTCPGNLLATAVTATSVTIAWLPASDALSGLAGYNVYRGNAYQAFVPAGTETYTDTVSAGTTYNYAVTALDYAVNEQTSCPSLWVSTSPITLTLTKNADRVNAELDWNDVGLNEYVVYRSTSPQAASELKRVPLSQTQDPVLQDSVKVWYYYIQQRGF
jgi:hypothetical protein